ncbi:MAG: transketolase C-terminal domain-containing protein [Candidatus Poseidoniia archaeon]|nr:transketolase C-terminal domain-containing protein [Candidatus Poseidoniia archaeon]
MVFPVSFDSFVNLELNANNELTNSDLKSLTNNIELVRDAVIATTAFARAKGIGGHTGGPYDIVPEVLIVDALRDGGEAIHDEFFDEAGHRSAVQYVRGAIRGKMPTEKLMHYREYGSGLAGHPEPELLDCIDFSTGRLGHAAGHVNGVAIANPDSAIVMYGSDGAQMEGNNAEAARLAVANELNVKWIIDDNNVTIAGNPETYMKGYSVSKTLEGQGFQVITCDGENYSELFDAISKSMQTKGPVAVICKRKMGPGIPDMEGECNLHDVIPLDIGIKYLEKKGHNEAVKQLKETAEEYSSKANQTFKGSGEKGACRKQFGTSVVNILNEMSDSERKRIHAFDSDLEGSVGLTDVRQNYPECFTRAGIHERGNYLAAAGFGSQEGRQGIFATFSAFMEMVISEITMSRLNEANVLAHFSHAGVDNMSDNTCHFGLNNFFADNYVEEGSSTGLYFPADVNQMDAIIKRIFNDHGLRFVFSNRSKTPLILNSDGGSFYGEGYEFTPGTDEIIRDGDAGWIVSYGDMLHRCLHVVEEYRENGINVGLINKPSLSSVDEDTMEKIGKSPFVLVVESLNSRTGLGVRFGTWLLERGFAPNYDYMGTTRPGNCGQEEQILHQGLGIDGLREKLSTFL